MSNRMEIKKATTKNKEVEIENKDLPKETSAKSSFLSAKKSKGNKPSSFSGKSSKAFSKKKT